MRPQNASEFLAIGTPLHDERFNVQLFIDMRDWCRKHKQKTKYFVVH
jgi:hypothetical protein